MVRFKVFKGSHILLGAAIVLLLTVVGVIIFNLSFSAKTGIEDFPGYAMASSGNETETRAISAFASGFVSGETSVNGLQVEIIPDPTNVPSPRKQPCILIYHTHTHEAYEQDRNDPYIAIETWRTEDAQHSVVRVGDALAEELEKKGYEVVHITADHELNSIDDSYLRSLSSLENNKGSYDITIDLHRDAYSRGMEECYTNKNGDSCAQVMLLVGRGDAYPPEEKPNYESNLNFAQAVTTEMNRMQPGICRNVTVKTGRYNQHLGSPGLLIEVGHNRNTLQQALAVVPYLADALDSTIQKTD